MADSWEDLAEDGAEAKPSWNLGASEFVPSFTAPAFVPGASWTPPADAPAAAPAAPAPAAATPAEPEATTQKVATLSLSTKPAAEEKKPAKEEKSEKPAAAPKKAPEPTPEPEEEEEEEEDDDVPAELLDKREHLNIVFVGHVDAGKSTIGGHLMFLTGGVDKRTLEKYEREAKEKNRESWYLSWALDTNDEERAKGKTVECGLAHFTTESKHFTVIDAPGHRSFVPNMISGAAQADVAVLVISARKGEFETGFEGGGQTREHAMLVKTAGVKHLVVVINKMDDSTVEWSEARYLECKNKLVPFLKKVGFNPKEVQFMPISGQTGANLLTPLDKSVCPWFEGPALVPFLDSLPKIVRLLDVPLRMPITAKYRDMGTIVLGKLQSGKMRKGNKLLLMPNKQKIVIDDITADEEPVDVAVSGDNVKVKIKGAEEEDVASGYVICPIKSPCSVATVFDAQVIIMEYKSIICPGFNAILHIHSAVEEVTLKTLICEVNKKTGKPDKSKGRPRFTRQGQIVIARLETSLPICIETYKEHPHMGRFTLRDEGRSIAIGKVLKLFPSS